MSGQPTSKGEQASSPWAALGPVVPVPSILIDRLLPRLTDTELRVLLVVVRQTLGWISDDSTSGHKNNVHGRKWRDWISQSQLVGKTGKSRDSVSRAVGALVESGLVVVEKPSGEPLTSAHERKLARTRLYYRLADQWFQRGDL
nr:hypothetical protein [Armatimonas sp.]